MASYFLPGSGISLASFSVKSAVNMCRTRGRREKEQLYERAVSCPPPPASRLTHNAGCKKDPPSPIGQFLTLTHLRNFPSRRQIHFS